ncbi:Putative pleckstrin domain, UDP-glucuronosyl/UDP-glucosyltransferase, GRAM domain-containing protein [Septoria linicola]|uniref:Sterol 3-beta-glucosyltransferase n=1 Tax=Septoria linicola TaxID=215465 RepID=A0A9Q9AW08_9PEZI|nr:Putative pleckstrin domain, UDP-glucuronosyl/UDP-glucosyltransferase, GRAM domain-containing protein [Septoria linicola]
MASSSASKQHDIAASQPVLPRRRSSDCTAAFFKGGRLGRIRSPIALRRTSMDLPDRLKFNEEEEEDVDDGTGLKDGFPAQSMYGMLAATQSKPDFKTQFIQQESASESEGDEGEPGRRSVDQRRSSKEVSRESYQIRPPVEEAKVEDSIKKHKKRLSVNKLARSILGKSELGPVRERADSSSAQDPMTQSQILPPRRQEAPEGRSSSVRSDLPVLDRKLQAMAKAELDSSTATLGGRKSREGRTSEDMEKRKTNKSLPHVIADIFQFDEPEEVISEFPCWYLQNVLLQGFMYITQKHVCFYAYLQKKTATTVKTGHLGKLGKHSYRYRRYWFVLKGDTFSYYKSSAEPYFPNGVVDLRYAISAELASVKDKEETAADFTITTSTRVYQYRADTLSSAKEWVKQLQKVIFRSHNDGDSVKISLPIDSILDVERTEVVDFAETIKLRVIDNEETFAVDEYFFTFFQLGDEAINTLSVLTANNNVKKALAEEAISPLSRIQSPPDRTLFRRSVSAEHSPRLDPVRATLSPLSAADRASPRLSSELRRTSTDHSRRASGEYGRASFDRGRRSVSGPSRNASKSPMSPSIQESSESFVTSSEQPDSSIDGDAMDASMSASQMLSDDHVFRGPTLRMPQPRRTVSGNTVERLRQESQPSSRGSSAERGIPLRIQPPSRAAAENNLSGRRPAPQRTDSGDSARTAEAEDQARPEASAPKLIRGMSTPLQHAMSVAGAVRAGSRRMGSYLSSSPKTYITNWTEAMAGGKRHYTDVEGLAPDDSVRELEQDLDVAEHERRFREHFGLPPTEKLVSVFYCWLHKTVPLWGKIYMGTRRLCFRSLYYGTKTKLIIPYKDILNVQKQRGFRWGYPGMVLVIRGYEELFFDFQDTGLRDDCVVSTLRTVEAVEAAAESMILTEEEQQDANDAAAENALLRAARNDGHAEQDLDVLGDAGAPPVLFDDPSASVLEFKPKQSLKITCLTIGSRGDVQPYIALCKGFLADGHQPTIATHAEFRPWVERHGIAFKEVDGDPAELMRICVENGMFTPSFFLEANGKFRSWLDDLLVSSWKACQGADLVIDSPSAMSGIHIAEALEVPYFRAFTMPWTRTRAYPHAFAVPRQKRGGAGQINRWRGKTLKLGPTSLDRLQQNKVPFLYNFSPSVVPQPLDFSDWIKVTGYWFLDEGTDYTPPEELAGFIKKARDDDQKLVYIGFGSVTVSDSRQLMQQIVDAVVKADVRCILSKGWSDRFEKAETKLAPLELPSCIHQIRAAPHDWLFKQVDAVVHHGGAGTTGASLRVGVPTIIKPFFGDQFFFATRVEDLGVGMHLKKVTANQLGKALWIATHDARMRTKARLLGEAIRSENGVGTAINAVYRDLEYARSLIKKKGPPRSDSTATSDGVDGNADISEDTEENWTFIEKEGDAAAETGAWGTLATGLGGAGPPRRSSSNLLSPQRSHASSSGQHSRKTSLGSMVLRGGRP